MTTAAQQAPWQQMIPVRNLHPNPDNPRKDPGDLKGLTASIREAGLKQALVVFPAPDLGPEQYCIEDGWRRYLAMRDWRTEIRCDIHPDEFSAQIARTARNVITALVTDAHRKHLNPMERAEGFGRLAELGMSAADISRDTGLHISTVVNGLALLEFADADREKIRSGELPVTEALKIIRRVRAGRRRKQGRPHHGAVWEPDHFTAQHPLARIAKAMCDAREHNSRRRRGGACDHCWEDSIRQDQTRIVEATHAARERFAGQLNGSPVGDAEPGLVTK